MKISDLAADEVVMEPKIFRDMLPLKNAKVLELGCGKAELTRIIAETGEAASITALEVDEIQHRKNLLIDDLPAVEFKAGGAEAIPADDETFDLVLMFKSLHHVPLNGMDMALSEIRRVLKPGGLAYISEPVYAGDFNDLLRLFHDEKKVRLAAFKAIKRAVESGLFDLEGERFFSTPQFFSDFDDFNERVLKVTHTQHKLPPPLFREVKEKFLSHMTPDGVHLTIPVRVDLLRKKG